MSKWEYKERKFYNKKHYTINKEEKVVELSPEMYQALLAKNLYFIGSGHGFKKIGGSSIGAIMGMNSFATPFSESIRIMNLGMPIYDSKYIDAGMAVEPKLIEKIEKASGLKIKTYPGPEYGYDFFKDEENVGGLPDGYMEDKSILFEIKTTGLKNKDKWEKEGIPEYYKLQAQLYSYLMRKMGMKVDKTILSAVFLEPGDYDNLNAININNREIVNYPIENDDALVEAAIEKAAKIRKKLMATGKSFKYDEKKDAELLEYLMIEDIDQYYEYLERKGIYKKPVPKFSLGF